MKADECYDKWLASKQAVNVPEGWSDAVMQRIERHEGPRRNSARDLQSWVNRLCGSVPARAAVILAGMAVCVTRFVVLCLAVLG